MAKENTSCSFKTSIGGQALLEGILMRGPEKQSIVCRLADGTLKPSSGWTNIFIYPGYEFRCIDALITNFHLPESTLIMLVSALAGRENILHAYSEAVKERYRFFSFGDAMFIY